MSTLATQINWGASYLVNDFYHRFIAPKASDRHLTWASRIATVIVLVMGGIATTFITSVDKAWKFIAALGAGTGAVFMLRWFWWRINAWTEIAAMVGSLVFFVGIQIVLYVTKDTPESRALAPGAAGRPSTRRSSSRRSPWHGVADRHLRHEARKP